eukprot:scaffold1038_cov79-Skeletonema_dohrnii-CCMP3373.AAC.2
MRIAVGLLDGDAVGMPIAVGLLDGDDVGLLDGDAVGLLQAFRSDQPARIHHPKHRMSMRMLHHFGVGASSVEFDCDNPSLDQVIQHCRVAILPPPRVGWGMVKPTRMAPYKSHKEWLRRAPGKCTVSAGTVPVRSLSHDGRSPKG